MGLFKNISNKIKSIKGKKRKWTVEKKPRIERKTNRTTKKKGKINRQPKKENTHTHRMQKIMRITCSLCFLLDLLEKISS